MLQRNFLSVPKSDYVLLRKEEFRDVMTFQGIPACSIFSNVAETEEHLQRQVIQCNSGEFIRADLPNWRISLILLAEQRWTER